MHKTQWKNQRKAPHPINNNGKPLFLDARLFGIKSRLFFFLVFKVYRHLLSRSSLRRR